MKNIQFSNGLLNIKCSFPFFLFVLVLLSHNSMAAPSQAFDNANISIELKKLMRTLKGKPDIYKVNKINQFFNQIPRYSDRSVWGKDDYWATPNELMRLNKGDCEDLAIAKYFVLRRLGLSEEKLHLAYGKSFDMEKNTIEPHMVLVYYRANGESVVLDSLKNNLNTINNRDDLILEYTFDTEWVWKIENGIKTNVLGKAESIHKWNDLLTRM